MSSGEACYEEETGSSKENDISSDEGEDESAEDESGSGERDEASDDDGELDES